MDRGLKLCGPLVRVKFSCFRRPQASGDKILTIIPLSRDLSKYQKQSGSGKADPPPPGCFLADRTVLSQLAGLPCPRHLGRWSLSRGIALTGCCGGGAHPNSVIFPAGPRGEQGIAGESFLSSSSSISEVLSARECPRVLQDRWRGAQSRRDIGALGLRQLHQ